MDDKIVEMVKAVLVTNGMNVGAAEASAVANATQAREIMTRGNRVRAGGGVPALVEFAKTLLPD